MCGITGFIGSNRELVSLMNQALQHRGPDDEGIFVDQHISLGHRRLAILDLSPRGHQPMTFEHLTITFNGEIYNYAFLQAELINHGYTFTSTSDTEVILKAFHAWGSDCFKKLNGMFALAIWDSRRQALWLVRDRAGIKPLFYYAHSNQLIFASEIKAILAHPGIDRTIVPERISYIVDLSCLPGALTMFRHIHQLPAGQYACWQNNKLTLQPYWQPDAWENISLNYGEAVNQVRATVTGAIESQLISDVPTGVFLSGGVDSSIVALIASRSSKKPLQTFSIGFDLAAEKDKFNADAELARTTAAFLGAEHHEIIMQSGQALEYLRHSVNVLDMPNSMATAVPSFWLSKFARQSVEVVLGGDGGDELFGGYPRYQLSRLLSYWFSLPASLRRVLPYEQMSRLFGHGDWAAKLANESYAARYIHLKLPTTADATQIIRMPWYKPDVAAAYITQTYFNQGLPTTDFEKYFMSVDAATWLVDHSLLRSDAATMAHGLEQRVPFLDNEVMDLARQLPTSFKLDFWRTKKILKDAFYDQLPPQLFNQPKRGWFAPAAKWLRTELKDFAFDVLADDFVPESKEFFDLPAARKLLTDHIAGRRYNLHLLWILITWQLWYRQTVLGKKI